MQKFRFRAWDPVDKKMLYPVDIFNSQGYWWEDTPEGDLNLNLITDSMGSRRTLVLTQSTGVLDINKKEIFTGDIVKADKKHPAVILNPDLEQYTDGEVNFYNQSWHVVQRLVGGTALHEFAMCDCCPCALEVIGNIYENPRS